MNKFYESKKNPNIKATLEREELGKYIMMYYGGNKDGEEFTVTESTLKRWWKKVEEEVVETVEKVEEKQVQEMPEAVEELIKDVDEEVEKACEELHIDSKTLKPKKEKKVKKEKSVPMYSFSEIIDIVKNLGFETKLYEKLPNMIVVKLNGKTVCELRVQKKHITINVKSDVAEKLNLQDTKIINNYYLPIAIVIDYTSNTIEDVKKILDVIYK